MAMFACSDQPGVEFVRFEPAMSLFDGQRFDFVMHTVKLLLLSERTNFDQWLNCGNLQSILLV